MGKYSKENLNNLRFHALREIGWQVGVKSPSTRKKQDLIQEILDVTEGKKAPYKTTKGRPRLPTQLNFVDLNKQKFIHGQNKQNKELNKQIDEIIEKLDSLRNVLIKMKRNKQKTRYLNK